MGEEGEGIMVDRKRGKRTGLPEVVFAMGKNEKALLGAVEGLLNEHPVLVTKANAKQLDAIMDRYGGDVEADEKAGVAKIGGNWKRDVGRCAVISAGTSDVPVAEEAAFSLEYLGIDPLRAYDRGVAGMHRVESILDVLREEPKMGVVVVAGMEGALPSVVASTLSQPVVAVPTSIGYGSSFQGLSALLGMLNSCVPGITVVNIDNGFGAAAAIYRGMRTWGL
ncbi:MAG: nickel pincer cofactor biosynthesis protein LarB [Thermoplasmata archaeon]|nr:nickel pincer cofactor biosynthesis protein LarB [Thermoplasmata archaeon]